MTVIGLDSDGDVVLLVVEKSHRSRGITVAEAARLLRRRFDVRDAIVLGAAGDSQLATTAEGFLTVPFVADYARSAARPSPTTCCATSSRDSPPMPGRCPATCFSGLRPSWPGGVRRTPQLSRRLTDARQRRSDRRNTSWTPCSAAIAAPMTPARLKNRACRSGARVTNRPSQCTASWVRPPPITMRS